MRILTNVCTIATLKGQDQARERALLASKATDVLTDGALKVTMDLGEEALAGQDGMEQLILAMEEHAMQYKSDEARDLFHAGTQVDGAMARQPGETMTSYIARRRRWFQRLQALDSETKVSENILADYLPACSGLERNHWLLIRTV